jgi:hypothetical protein
MRVEYSSNNSGDSWWLKDDDWKALEKAGWKVDWQKDVKPELFKADAEGRWLGALATHASKNNCASLKEAVDEWEKITGACSTDAGCPCCGQPHYFTLYDDEGKFVDSGPIAEDVASW